METRELVLTALIFALGLRGKTTLSFTWVMLLALIFYSLLEMSPLNTEDKNEESKGLLLFVSIGIAVAYYLLGRVF